MEGTLGGMIIKRIPSVTPAAMTFVARQAFAPSATPTTTTRTKPATSRIIGTSTPTSSNDTPDAIVKYQTSGLSPVELGLIVGCLVGAFIVMCLVGFLCKLINRPSQEAHPYTAFTANAGGGGGLYQPSAAGYGGKRSAASSQPDTPQLGAGRFGEKFGSQHSLIGHAGPLGRGGRAFDAPGDVTLSMSEDGAHGGAFGRQPSNSYGHARGSSSGVALPGPAASRRPGMGGHPATSDYGTGGSPDGGSFKPGQVLNPSGLGPVPGSSGPSGYASRPGVGHPHLRSSDKGPPPAQDPRRRSRYARQGAGGRIDSVGPGVMRKSMFLGDDLDNGNGGRSSMHGSRQSLHVNRQSVYANGGGGGGGGGGGNRASRRISRRPSDGEGANTGNQLRRVDSVGKGDARRRSQYQTEGGRNGQRTPSYYMVAADRATMKSAKADNFGSGRNGSLGGGGGGGSGSGGSDPLGARDQYGWTTGGGGGHREEIPAMPQLSLTVSGETFASQRSAEMGGRSLDSARSGGGGGGGALVANGTGNSTTWGFRTPTKGGFAAPPVGASNSAAGGAQGYGGFGQPFGVMAGGGAQR